MYLRSMKMFKEKFSLKSRFKIHKHTYRLSYLDLETSGKYLRTSLIETSPYWCNIIRTIKKRPPFACDSFKTILYENCCILIVISLNILIDISLTKGQINNVPALVDTAAWLYYLSIYVSLSLNELRLLTHWGRDKMADKFADDIFKCIFLKNY